MAHDTILSTPVGSGDTIVTVDLSLGTYPTGSQKLPASCLYVSANTSTAPTPVTAANGLYVQPGTSTTWAISAASLPLPSGASTSAKQPALGTAGTASSDVITVQGVAGMTPLSASQSGTWNVTINAALPAGTNVIGHVIADSGSTTAVTGNVTVVQSTGSNLHTVIDSGNITTVSAVTAITNALPAGTNVIGHVITDSGSVAAATQSGTWTVQPGNTPNTTPWLIQEQAGTAGGTQLPYSFLSTNAVQAATIKASAGQVYAIHFFNINATPVYVRLYNETSTPGTGDTVVYRAIIPGNTAGAGFVCAIPPGTAFGTGIGIRVTAAIADNDNTALTANTVIGNVFYD